MPYKLHFSYNFSKKLLHYYAFFYNFTNVEQKEEILRIAVEGLTRRKEQKERFCRSD